MGGTAMRAGKGCVGCRDGEAFPIEFTMAFHPIVNVSTARIWGYEALVRGTEGQSAAHILGRVDAVNRYAFDQACRVKAIEMFSGLRDPVEDLLLAINFLPNAVYEPNLCIRLTLETAERVGLDPKVLMFEFAESEHIADISHIAKIIETYGLLGFTTAIDDFGAGYAGLNFLARFQPDVLKIDVGMVRGIDTSRPRQAIVAGIMSIAHALGLKVIAEGVETEAELATLREAGIEMFQGFLFARPAIERLPPVAGMSVAGL